MRFRLASIIFAITAHSCLAQDQQKLRSAREIAEAMIRPSGPVRMEPAAMITPPQWRAETRVAGSYANPAARDRFVRHTHAWRWPYGWYYRPYYGYRCW